MNTRTTNFSKSLLVAAALLVAPLASHAHSDVAMDACVKAFVSTSLEKERPVTVQKSDAVYSTIDQNSRFYRISLKAVGKHSGEQVAKGTCVVSRDGEVRSISGKSVATPAAVLSSR